MWILFLQWGPLFILWFHAHLPGMVLQRKGPGIQILKPVHLQTVLVVWGCTGGEVAGFPENCLIWRLCLSPWLPRLLDKVCNCSRWYSVHVVLVVAYSFEWLFWIDLKLWNSTGGCKKIPGILYLENSDFARRSRFVAWRAAVEMSTSAEQLALQVWLPGLMKTKVTVV